MKFTDCFNYDAPALTRRDLLKGAGCGFGSLAMSAMAAGADGSLAHHAPKAKRVIFLFMHGGPSQVDTFDPKPERQAKLFGSPWKFKQYGQSGLPVSELFPNVAQHVDDLCVVRSMQSKGQSHGQAVCMAHTGTDNFVRPSVGAWVNYGLGEINSNLPGFISISPSASHGGPRNYGPAFLPAKHQATTIGANGKLSFSTQGKMPICRRRNWIFFSK